MPITTRITAAQLLNARYASWGIVPAPPELLALLVRDQTLLRRAIEEARGPHARADFHIEVPPHQPTPPWERRTPGQGFRRHPRGQGSEPTRVTTPAPSDKAAG